MSGLSIVSSDPNKNCALLLKHSNPVVISIASYRSEGYVDAHEISIGSVALTVKAEFAQKSGRAILPGLDVITFSPDKKAKLLRKNNTLLIVQHTDQNSL